MVNLYCELGYLPSFDLKVLPRPVSPHLLQKSLCLHQIHCFIHSPPWSTCKVRCAKDSSPALSKSRIYWKHQSFVHPRMQSPELVELCRPHPRAADLRGICGMCDICAQPISSARAQGPWHGECRGKQHLRASAAAGCPWYILSALDEKGQWERDMAQMPYPTRTAAWCLRLNRAPVLRSSFFSCVARTWFVWEGTK